VAAMGFEISASYTQNREASGGAKGGERGKESPNEGMKTR